MRRVNLTGLSGLSGVTAAALLMVMACAGPARAGVIVVDFEDLDAGTRYGPGESFETGGVVILVEEGAGRGTPSASLAQSGQVNSIGNDLLITGGVHLSFPHPVDAISFRLARTGRFGGDPSIGIGTSSGTITAVDLIEASVSPVIAGGFLVSATLISEEPLLGEVALESIAGDVSSLLIRSDTRGHPASVADLVVDDFTLIAPEPATALALLAGFGVVLAQRRRIRR